MFFSVERVRPVVVVLGGEHEVVFAGPATVEYGNFLWTTRMAAHSSPSKRMIATESDKKAGWEGAHRRR
jgi:hypothetical protein